MININLDNIADPVVRENLEKLSVEFRANPFLNGDFKFFEVVIPGASSGYKFKHNLRYTPRDVIISYVSDGQTATVNYELIDSNYINFDFSGACIVRFFAGSSSQRFGG